jgi:hypothetical protein
MKMVGNLEKESSESEAAMDKGLNGLAPFAKDKWWRYR